jgi:hypothetical protein
MSVVLSTSSPLVISPRHARTSSPLSLALLSREATSVLVFSPSQVVPVPPQRALLAVLKQARLVLPAV